MNRPAILALLLLTVALILGGCTALPTIQSEHKRGTGVPSNTVVVVGKIDLQPALGKDEQKFIGMDPFGFFNTYRQRVLLYLNNVPQMAAEDGLAINPELGKLYAFEIPKSEKYVVGGYVSLKLDPATRNDRRIHIPLGLKLDINPSDRFIYIGNITITRDEFSEVTNIQIVDDYPAISAQFARQYGSRAKLRKAIPARL